MLFDKYDGGDLKMLPHPKTKGLKCSSVTRLYNGYNQEFHSNLKRLSCNIKNIFLCAVIKLYKGGFFLFTASLSNLYYYMAIILFFIYFHRKNWIRTPFLNLGGL